ncbi:hypothetical protein [Geminocystis herdmanii]|uniref:hypothetical protein n=1 Tax=Geminocystis herdmanii TaxID=669359 RepID=UPI0036F27297
MPFAYLPFAYLHQTQVIPSPSIDMIRIALAYGKYQFHSNARTWTLLDKCLRNTMYERTIDRLRGLRIIAPIDKQGCFKVSW